MHFAGATSLLCNQICPSTCPLCSLLRFVGTIGARRCLSLCRERKYNNHISLQVFLEPFEIALRKDIITHAWLRFFMKGARLTLLVPDRTLFQKSNYFLKYFYVLISWYKNKFIYIFLNEKNDKTQPCHTIK